MVSAYDEMFSVEFSRLLCGRTFLKEFISEKQKFDEKDLSMNVGDTQGLSWLTMIVPDMLQ